MKRDQAQPETTSDDSDRYTGDVILTWYGDETPPDGVEVKVIEDIRVNLGGISCPGDLITHHVKLTDDWNGPGVHVHGVEGDPAFHCLYHSVTRWVSGRAEVETHD